MKRFLTSIILSFIILSAKAQSQDTINIIFIGDVMAHGLQLRTALKPGCDSLLSDSYDFSTYFKYIKPKFMNSNLVVANMEFPSGVTPYSGYPRFSAPNSLAKEAIKSGVDLFLTANNHICDKGKQGLDSTYSLYNRIGIPYTGFYASEKEEIENNPLIVNVSGINVAFINFTYAMNGYSVPEPYKVNFMDTIHVRKVIERAIERGADIIIATPHWGEEYNLDISENQSWWENFLYDCGVRVIIGTHPHVVQKVKYYGNRVTAFSLGNYISNMSITNGQIGMLFNLKLIKDKNGSINILKPDFEYLWCARGGKFEKNYTVIPIKTALNRKKDFISKEEYQKMKKEWSAIKLKFNIND